MNAIGVQTEDRSRDESRATNGWPPNQTQVLLTFVRSVHILRQFLSNVNTSEMKINI